MLILFANEKADGYRFGRLIPGLAFLDSRELGGLLPRWQIGFNITMLRIVSFALDAHWRQPPASASHPADQRSRSATSLSEEDYSLVNYLAYTLYAPLYIAGPILTFNDFCWQLQHPVEITRKTRISYALRFAFCMLTMESILHTMYVVAIKDTEAWHGNGPAELSMIGFWNLIVVWLKVSFAFSSFELTHSSSSRGVSSVYGRYSTASTRPRTWSAAWRTTTRPSASGAAGTGATTSGSCDTSTSRSAARSA
jgi:hypothetical protein